MIPSEKALIERAYDENRAQINISIRNKIAKYKSIAVRSRIKGDFGVSASFRDLAESLEYLVGV